MTVIIGKDEQNKFLFPLGDKKDLLKTEDGDRYDAHVVADDGSEWTFERKQYDDFIRSWRDGSLEEQAARVDGLIIEEWPDSDETPEHGNADLYQNGRKHGWHLMALGWVVPTDSPYDTATFLRYVEKKGRKIELTKTRIEHEGATVRECILNALPRVNTRRALSEDETVLDVINEEHADWEAVYEALGVEEWDDIRGFGEGTIQLIHQAIVEGEES